MSNAVKFTRTRTRAEIEIRAIPEGAGPNEVVIVVRDNGVGFDMAYVDKLFATFKRLHAEFEGSGIGLASVARIVRRHGGRVWAEGEPQVGSSFYFALPGALRPPGPGS
jgi:signal transduction histidine kinase